MEKNIFENPVASVLSGTSAKQAARNVLALKAAEKFKNDDAMKIVFDLTREQDLDPSSPEFDQKKFLKQVRERLKKK